jgi:hypothetical protein
MVLNINQPSHYLLSTLDVKIEAQNVVVITKGFEAIELDMNNLRLNENQSHKVTSNNSEVYSGIPA